MATDRPLRIALILLNPDEPPGWVARLAQEIARDDALRLCALVTPGQKRRRVRTNRAFSLLQRAEVALTARRPPVDVAAFHMLVSHLPRLQSHDEADLTACKVDILLDLSGDFGLSVATSAAAHGVWFTDATSTIAGAAGLKPLLGQEAVSVINLFRRTAHQGVPAQIAAAAVDGKFIAARNSWFLEEKSVALILRELRRCARDGQPGKGCEGVAFVVPAAPSYAELLRYLAQMLGKLLARGFEAVAERLRMRPGMFHLRVEQEESLILFAPEMGQKTRPADNSFYADPFLVQHAGTDWCLFERYDYAERRGAIWAGQLKGDQVVGMRRAIDPGYHLSFPFPIEHEGELFVMPESCAMRRLEVWRCVVFPDQWELHATALEGSMIADSALLELDGEWWIFANMASDPFGDISSEMHLYRTSGPDLAWVEPHRLNPVVFDSRMARNAGRVHRIGDALYRPAQDNSHGKYGYGLQIMRIETVGEDEYREHSARHVRPDFGTGVIGIHHIDRLGDRVIFDVRERLGGIA